MASEIGICNSAIAKVRGKRILSLSDTSLEASLCTSLYPEVRDALLRGHPWNFNKARVMPALLVQAPAFEYDNAYQMPPDCAKILRINNVCQDEKWVYENNQILINDSSGIEVLYGRYITDASKFDAQFAAVCAYALAVELAYPITQSSSLAERLQTMTDKKLREARSMNAQERGSVEAIRSDQWLNARY